MKAVIIALAFVAIAYCQTPPTISASSTATTVATFANRTFQGTEYIDAQNQRTAFVHKFNDGNEDDNVAFTSNHSEYNFGTFNGTHHCEARHDPRPWFNIWEWVAHSKSAGACTGNGKSGTAWAVTDDAGTFTLCAAADIPLTVSFKDAHDGHVDTTTYTSFVPGVPPVSDFAVPSHCHH